MSLILTDVQHRLRRNGPKVSVFIKLLPRKHSHKLFCRCSHVAEESAPP